MRIRRGQRSIEATRGNYQNFLIIKKYVQEYFLDRSSSVQFTKCSNEKSHSAGGRNIHAGLLAFWWQVIPILLVFFHQFTKGAEIPPGPFPGEGFLQKSTTLHGTDLLYY